MTHHYVNLLTWETFLEMSENVEKSAYSANVDSISLRLMLKLVGVSKQRISGFAAFQERDSTIHLLAYDYEKLVPSMVLPYWKRIEDIRIDSDFIKRIECYENVYIGISGPKHDALAFELNKFFPEKNIFCFGAAMYTDSTLFDKYGLNWIYMLIVAPRRTLNKLKITFSEIFSILFNKEKRLKLRRFGGRI